MLGKEEIVGAETLDGGVEGVIIEQDSAENAAFSFEIVREGPFQRGVAASHSLYFRPVFPGAQEAVLVPRGALVSHVRRAVPRPRKHIR